MTHKLLPFEPTSAMYNGLARNIMSWEAQISHKSAKSLYKYLDYCRVTIPAWLKEELPDFNDDHYLTNATRSVLIYKAMYHDYKE